MPDASSLPRGEIRLAPLNNFDALRFWAALAVLWSHAVPLSYGSEAREALFSVSGGQSTIGTLAVTFFFAISGFLITRSFDRTRSPARFFLSRALRIMPGLLVVLVLCAFVMGPIVTSVAPAQYFRSIAPWKYVLEQATFVRFFDELPGVFGSNPMRWVNGSLWTLRHEVECYALVFLLGIAGLLNRYVTLGLYVAGLAALAVADQHMVFDGSHAPQMNFHLDLGTKFLAGALIYQWRVPLRGKAALVCLAVLMGCVLFGQLAMAQRTVLAYLVMYLALAAPFNLPSPAARFGDLSYGTYIYAWPVKQLVVLCSHQPHWFVTAAVSTPIVLVLAWLSWHFVEKGALALKDRPFPGIAAKSRSTEPPPATRRVLRTHQ